MLRRFCMSSAPSTILRISFLARMPSTPVVSPRPPKLLMSKSFLSSSPQHLALRHHVHGLMLFLYMSGFLQPRLSFCRQYLAYTTHHSFLGIQPIVRNLGVSVGVSCVSKHAAALALSQGRIAVSRSRPATQDRDDAMSASWEIGNSCKEGLNTLYRWRTYR